MPAKKGNKAQEPPQTRETQTEEQSSSPPDDVNQRLAHIEADIEKMAAHPVERPAPRIPSPSIMTTRGWAKTANDTKTSKNRRSVSVDADFNRTHGDISQSGPSNNVVMGQTSQREAAWDATSHVAAHDQPRRHTAVLT